MAALSKVKTVRYNELKVSTKATNPSGPVLVPEVPGNKVTLSKKTFSVPVLLLDDQIIEVHIATDALAQELVSKLCSHLQTEDVEFFGLFISTEKQDGTKWIKLDKPAKKQFRKKGILHLRIKFYPAPHSTLKSATTCHLLCLQLQKDLNSGRLPATNLDLITLSALLTQIELGTYDLSIHHGNYIANTPVAPPNSRATDLVNSIIERHRSNTSLIWQIKEFLCRVRNSGMSNAEAVSRYLDYAQRMPLYGATLFPVKDIEINNTDMFVSGSGIDLYQNDHRIHGFKWQNILEMSCRRVAFCLTVRSDLNELGHDRLVFRGRSDKDTRRMWKFCIDCHNFYRPRRADYIEPKVTRKPTFRLQLGKTKPSVKQRTQVPALEAIYATVLPRAQRATPMPRQDVTNDSVSDDSESDAQDEDDELIYAVPDRRIQLDANFQLPESVWTRTDRDTPAGSSRDTTNQSDLPDVLQTTPQPRIPRKTVPLKPSL